MCCGQQSGEAATEHRHVDVGDDRLPGRHRGVWVDFVITGEVVLEFDVLLGSLGAQPFGTLPRVFFPQTCDVDAGGSFGWRAVTHRPVSFGS